VASSLDSMVIGEAQILGQVKEAYRIAYENKATSLILNRLFRHAVECGKRVRTETAIGEAPVSVSYAAVQLAKNVFETLENRPVMVVGAGKMSILTIKHLVANGANPIMVTNRTYKRAEEVACEFNGIAVPFEERFERMVEADIVISSTGAQNYVITPDEVRKIMRQRRGKLDVVPTIKELTRIAQEIKEKELEKALRRLNGLDDDQIEVVKALAHGIVNKMLHTPIVRIKEAAAKKRGYRYVVAMRYLFGLDDAGKEDGGE
jgi:glutamyl-tRNA reductase